MHGDFGGWKKSDVFIENKKKVVFSKTGRITAKNRAAG
jgi:hypothetical protein